jgi:hypothetical protein
VNLANNGLDIPILPISVAVAHKQNLELIGADLDPELLTCFNILSSLKSFYESSLNTNERGDSRSEFNLSRTEEGGK